MSKAKLSFEDRAEAARILASGDIEAEVYALLDSLAKMDALICRCQEALTRYLQPGGPSATQTVQLLLGLLDGPAQREAQGGRGSRDAE